MRSSNYPVDEIRERCDLVDIVSRYVTLRKSGRRLLGLCPFHNEKTPSFHVDPDRMFWKCFGCGEGGDVFDFVGKAEGFSFPEAVEHLAKIAGVELPRPEKLARELSERDRVVAANRAACEYFQESLTKNKVAVDYLERRKISPTAVERYLLGYAPDSWDGLCTYLQQKRIGLDDAVKAGVIAPRENYRGFYDRFRGRLIFPIQDTLDRVIAFGGRIIGEGEPKYLNSPETPLFTKTKVLYGLNRARRAIGAAGLVIVVEGYMDTLSAQEAGFENTVATMGTALTQEHVALVARHTKSVVLAFDADSAGMAAAVRGAPMFEREGLTVRVMAIPKGEDPDSLLRSGDRTKFAELVENAMPVEDYSIKAALSVHDLDTEEGRMAALKDATAIVSHVESAVERERLVKSLARYHPNFSSGTTRAEEHIRMDLNRLRSMQQTRGVPSAGTKLTVDVVVRKKSLSLIEEAEKRLLGILVRTDIDPQLVFGKLPPDGFISELGRNLAAVVVKVMERGVPISAGSLRAEVEGTPAEGFLADLFMALDERELNDPVDELIRVVLDNKKNQVLARGDILAKQIEEGTVKRGDPEYEEWVRLVREISTSGGNRRRFHGKRS